MRTYGPGTDANAVRLSAVGVAGPRRSCRTLTSHCRSERLSGDRERVEPMWARSVEFRDPVLPTLGEEAAWTIADIGVPTQVNRSPRPRLFTTRSPRYPTVPRSKRRCESPGCGSAASATPETRHGSATLPYRYRPGADAECTARLCRPSSTRTRAKRPEPCDRAVMVSTPLRHMRVRPLP